MTPRLAHTPSFRLVCAGVTDRGRVRAENQDRFGLFPQLGLAIVADGMGGAVAGDVAARMAVELVGAELADAEAKEGAAHSANTMARRLVTAIEHANDRIYIAAKGANHQLGMGTTIVALQMRGRWAAVAHVGDSRAYQYRAGRLGQLTEDHSAFAECVRAGVVDPSHADRFPRRNIITRAVGPRPSVEVETRVVDVARGDVFLLCSDGLTGPLRHAELEAILRQHPDPDDAAASLVRRGNEAGGPDNITAVTVKCV